MPENRLSVSELRARFSSSSAAQESSSPSNEDSSAANSVSNLRAKFEGKLSLKTTPTSANFSSCSSSSTTNKKASTESLVSQSGATDMSKHSFDSQEEEHFIAHINQALAQDPVLSTRLPVDGPERFYEELTDGIILAKLINHASPDCIDERALNFPTPVKPILSIFQKMENLQIVVSSAKAIGCSVINVGPSDIYSKSIHIVLGLIWQIIRIDLLSTINLKCHPELFRIMESNEMVASGEGGDDSLSSPDSATYQSNGKIQKDIDHESLLLRWINWHLKQSEVADSLAPVRNFSSDLADCKALIALLHQLDSNCISLRSSFNNPYVTERAEAVVKGAKHLKCAQFITVESLLGGNPRLNLAFLANLFKHHSGLDPLEKGEEQKLLRLVEVESEETDRESRAFSFWINNIAASSSSSTSKTSMSRGAKGEFLVKNLFSDLRDGIVLLRVIDCIREGSVNFRNVYFPPPKLSKFKMIENTNYVIRLIKEMGLVVVGIQGCDIVEANRKLTLALVWQLMREHIVQTLGGTGGDNSSSSSPSQNHHRLSDADLLSWANMAAVSCPANSQQITISSFKDSRLRDSLFFLYILDYLKPGCVNYDLVAFSSTDGCASESSEQQPLDEASAKENARYALTIARKLGAVLFVLPEDIVEGNSKMILTFVASLMKLKRDNACQ